ncbi:MAG: recombination protein RecR [Armatimonadetes bacterium]|nr:recombination protein RecR [Armatimonadota bacterium]
MASFPRPVARLIDQLERLPGVGPKSAQRLALWLLREPPERVLALSESLSDAVEQVHVCPRCGYFAEGEACALCDDTRRDESLVCVVADARDLLAIESTDGFGGRYHVLGGVISPADGVGPDDLNVASLLARVEAGDADEVILALNPTPEGDTTANYLARVLRQAAQRRGAAVRLTRPALGLPVGGDLNYADRTTIERAMEGRREI